MIVAPVGGMGRVATGFTGLARRGFEIRWYLCDGCLANSVAL